jgi:hypothetical protein
MADAVFVGALGKTASSGDQRTTKEPFSSTYASITITKPEESEDCFAGVATSLSAVLKKTPIDLLALQPT